MHVGMRLSICLHMLSQRLHAALHHCLLQPSLHATARVHCTRGDVHDWHHHGAVMLIWRAA